jgi:hypothetical protein
MTGSVCCWIVASLCLSIFESLKNQGEQEASLSLGDVELSVGVRSICETWTPGFTSDSVCAICFHRTLFFWLHITSIIVCNKLKFWWHLLVILNTSKKIKNLHNNIFEFKVHFESKLILIQWLDEDNCIKSMYIEYITHSFSKTLGPHVYHSLNITKQKKNWKKMHCPFIKSLLLWYGSGFFLKIRYYYAFIEQMKNEDCFH